MKCPICNKELEKGDVLTLSNDSRNNSVFLMHLIHPYDPRNKTDRNSNSPSWVKFDGYSYYKYCFEAIDADKLQIIRTYA